MSMGTPLFRASRSGKRPTQNPRSGTLTNPLPLYIYLMNRGYEYPPYSTPLFRVSTYQGRHCKFGGSGGQWLSPPGLPSRYGSFKQTQKGGN